MATIVLTDASVTINSVDLSDHVKQISIDYSADILDATAMGSATTTHTKKGGLKDWSMKITFFQDYASGKVDATLFPLVGVATTVSVKATSAADGATNPNYTGTGIISSYPPISGSVGEMATADVNIVAGGTLTRDVTP